MQTRLRGGIGNVPGSSSELVERTLATEFDTPFAQFLLVVMEGADPALRDGLSKALSRDPAVKKVIVWPTRPGEAPVLGIGLVAPSLDEAEHLVSPVRKVVKAWAADHPSVHPLVTGQAAFDVDVAEDSAKQSSVAEHRVLPVTLAALLFGFGALGAALSPLVAGAGAVILAMGLISFIALLMPLSVYASSIASMLGLGLGIDYALFVVSRIREESRKGAGPIEVTPAAIREAVRKSAPFIAASAGTVVIGLAVLATVPVQDLIGFGVGGAIVAFTSALAGITLLPALAALLGKWIEAPKLISRPLSDAGRSEHWRNRARWVVARPWRSLILAAAILIPLSLPIRDIDLGFPEVIQLPQRMESIQGWNALSNMESAGSLLPINLLLISPPGESILTSARIVGMAEMVEAFRKDPRVIEVRGIADFRRGGRQLAAAAGLMGPDRVAELIGTGGRWLLSKDRGATVVQIILKSATSIRDKDAFHDRLVARKWSEIKGLEGLAVHVGGFTALNRDLKDTAIGSLPRVLGLVVLATLIMLFAVTRSYLIPLKAVLANLLTVTAALGGTLAVFRMEWSANLLGLSEPMTNIPPGIPIIVFCVVFGLSMDYEVFLISRIIEAHRAGATDEEAVVVGIGATGSVITSAALIMAIVFGGFALTRMIGVQMLGFALALGVLLDATVVRLLLVPALIVLFGKYNWVPGFRGDVLRQPVREEARDA